MTIRFWWRKLASVEVDRESLIRFVLKEAGISEKAKKSEIWVF